MRCWGSFPVRSSFVDRLLYRLLTVAYLSVYYVVHSILTNDIDNTIYLLLFLNNKIKCIKSKYKIAEGWVFFFFFNLKG